MRGTQFYKNYNIKIKSLKVYYKPYFSNWIKLFLVFMILNF